MNRQSLILIPFLLILIPGIYRPFGQTDIEKLQKRGDTLNTSKTYTVKADTHFFEIPENMSIITEELPIFPGGDKAVVDWILQNTVYPLSAINDSIEGRVVLRFAIDVDGSTSDFMPLFSVRSDLDSECIRVIKNMPKWKPGKVVRRAPKGLYWTIDKFWYTVPINFSLKIGEDKNGIIIRPRQLSKQN